MAFMLKRQMPTLAKDTATAAIALFTFTKSFIFFISISPFTIVKITKPILALLKL